MHRFSLSPACPGRIFLQHHGGVYRSDDYGENWTHIETGLPSDFGFALVAHPRRPDMAFCAILSSDDGGRWAPEGRMAIWRTQNAGAHWQAMRSGLPQQDAYITVLREAMAADGADPLGIYFGTRQGQVFASADEGENWTCIAANLPAVLGVAAAAER